MSENDNTEGGSSPKDVSEEFNFYFPFTKPLALDLSTPEERAIASAWVQKLEAEPQSEEEKLLRLNYLKLLLFVLQRGRLSGIFKKQPPAGPLEPFPQGLSIFDVGNLMLNQDDAPFYGGGDARFVPYNIEISNDLREFVASQEIPNFGVQMYYAWSSEEPINKWLFFDEDKFPQFVLDKIKQVKEVPSDVKSPATVCKKKGLDLPSAEKYSKKKVKTPQEIEKSQGRSFHTYMGLVGGMGNFNDKCDDDPNKFPRMEPRRGKFRRNAPKRPQTDHDDYSPEDMDNFIGGLGGAPPGGYNSINRPCFCPYSYPEKGSEMTGFPRNDNENVDYAGRGKRTAPVQRRLFDENCQETDPGINSVAQSRKASPRSKSTSPTRMECAGPSVRAAVCSCTSPCTCPCPRAPLQAQAMKTPEAAGVAGQPCLDHTYTKTPAGNATFVQSSPLQQQQPTYHQYRTPAQHDRTENFAGGRTGASSGIRPVSGTPPYNFEQIFDPSSMAKTVTKKGFNPDDSPDCEEHVKRGFFPNTNLKEYVRRERLVDATKSNVYSMKSRKELFDNQPTGPRTSPNAPSRLKLAAQAAVRAQYPRLELGSPPLNEHPVCERSPTPDPNQVAQAQAAAAAAAAAYSSDDFSGQSNAFDPSKTAPIKKYSPQGGACFQVSGGSGCVIENITNVLECIKQRTKAHRIKCEHIRSPKGCVYEAPLYKANNTMNLGAQCADEEGGRYQDPRLSQRVPSAPFSKSFNYPRSPRPQQQVGQPRSFHGPYNLAYDPCPPQQMQATYTEECAPENLGGETYDVDSFDQYDESGDIDEGTFSFWGPAHYPSPVAQTALGGPPEIVVTSPQPSPECPPYRSQGSLGFINPNYLSPYTAYTSTPQRWPAPQPENISISPVTDNYNQTQNCPP